MHQLYRPHRYQTNFPVMVQTADGKSKVSIIDVNETGARIEGVKGVSKGDRIRIITEREQIAGVVRWVGQDRIGVSFTPMISLRTVDDLRFARKPTTARRWSSTGLQEMR